MWFIGAGYWEGIGANVKRRGGCQPIDRGIVGQGLSFNGDDSEEDWFRLSVEIARKKIHLHIEFQHTVKQGGLLHLCILRVISHSPLLQ
jgi:hypothetical protein